jgi:hypothetical protein
MADLAGVNGTRKDFRVVGKPNLPGVLSWAQATGVAKFGIDYVVPDMLYAKFLRSPYPMGWDTLMVGLYLIAVKLGKDPINHAYCISWGLVCLTISSISNSLPLAKSVGTLIA